MLTSARLASLTTVCSPGCKFPRTERMVSRRCWLRPVQTNTMLSIKLIEGSVLVATTYRARARDRECPQAQRRMLDYRCCDLGCKVCEEDHRRTCCHLKGRRVCGRSKSRERKTIQEERHGGVRSSLLCAVTPQAQEAHTPPQFLQNSWLRGAVHRSPERGQQQH